MAVNRQQEKSNNAKVNVVAAKIANAIDSVMTTGKLGKAEQKIDVRKAATYNPKSEPARQQTNVSQPTPQTNTNQGFWDKFGNVATQKYHQDKIAEWNANTAETLLSGKATKNYDNKSKIGAALTGGYKMSQEEINNIGGYVDKATNQKADLNYIDALSKEINTKNDYLTKAYTDLNGAYQRGEVSYNDYINQFDALEKERNGLNKNIEKMNGFEYKSGMDYYNWLKENAPEEEVRDFEHYISTYDDSVLESMGNSFSAAITDYYSHPIQAYEMIRSVIDRDFDYSSDDALSTQMKQVSDELRSYTMNGANDVGFRRYSLATIQSLMPMIVETMHASFIGNAIGLEGKAYDKFVNQSVNIGMGMGSMSETFKRRLGEGNSFETSFMNAALHGFITYATEAFNVGGVTNLADFFTGAGGMGVLGDGLLSLPKFTAMLYESGKDFLAEGIEEVAEAYGDYWIDKMMSNIFGEEIKTDPLIAGGIGDNGLTDQFIMAGAGAMLMGLPSNVAVTVDSAKKYHASGEAVKYWNQFADYYNSQGDVQNAGVCQSIAQTIEQERQTYAQKSATTGVLLQEDIPTSAPSVEEALNAVANAMKLDVDDQIQNIEKAQASAVESLQAIDNELVRRGYGGEINLDTYLKATPEVRNASKNILDFANAIGADVMITDNFLAKENGNITVKQMDEGKHGVTINGKQIIINPFATDIVNNANEIMEQVLSHEITHTTEKSGKYSKLKQAVYEALGKEKWDEQYNKLKAKYEENGVTLKTKEAVEAEIVARYVGANMGNSKLLRNIANYNREGFSSIFTKMNTLLSQDPNSQIAQAFFDAYTDARKMVANPGTPQYSVGTIFQALGMTVEKDTEHTITAIKEDGTKTRKISTDDVINSPMGQMLRESVNYGNITEEEMNGQVEMLTNICNSLLQQQDADLFWAISGSIGYMPLSKGQNTSDVGNDRAFSAFTGNADPQYSETFDVITICTKTQQLIDVASAAMVKLNRGLTQKEIIDIVYNEVNKAGEPVPCPVCYVFSRWVGLGGVLNDIKNYQEKYRGADLEALKKRYTELCNEVDKLVGVKGKTFGKAQEALREQYDNEVQQRYSDLYSKDVTEQLGGKKMSAEEKAEYESLKKDLEILNDWSWVTNVLLDVHTNKGNRTIELNQKWLEMGEVPSDILFNLNRGEDFSKYAAWNYRTTRGAALGKTISPYTDMVLGQTILGMASPSRVKNLGEFRNQEKNAFLDMEATGEQFQEYGKAVQNTRMQNLKGGSRAQSTSDFRFEFVTDYLLHFMQLQAIGSYGQTYTKVPEAVPMLCSVGYEVNMSLMPKGKGFVEAKEGDPYAYYVKGFKGVKDGWYTLDFSDKTGINHTEAFYLREQYDNAQTIMVGINDVHNYLSRLDPRVDFIIPYHASGGTEVNYQSMMATLEEAVVEGARTSYEDNQNDKRVKNPTVEQEQAYNLRERIIKGEAAHLSEEEKEVLYRSNFLSDLWRRFYEKGYDPECYGVKMDDVAIFPYEYWDKNSTRETADINGRRFRDYCYELGIEPRFSQWVDEPGYWKTLIDRSMYNNDGTFHQQQAIKLDNFSTDFLYRGKMEKGLVQPENATKTFNRGRTSEIVDAVMDRLQYDISETSDDNYGYHYGAKNLDYNRKSERLWTRSGRGTGAFGTGTYVFGDGRKNASYFTKDRTEHKIDLSDYNMFKPKDAEQGYRLHRLFKELDDNYGNTGPKSVNELRQRVSDIVSELNEYEYDDEGNAKLSSEEEADIRERLLQLGDREEYIDELLDQQRDTAGGSVLADYLADELTERYLNEDSWRRRPRSLEWTEDYEIAMNHIPELAAILGEDEDYMHDVVNEAMHSAEIDSHKRDFVDGNYDSVGTRIMKKLGYEGIDVRHIPELDNSTYGSVIYDLNPDTVQYDIGETSDLNMTDDEMDKYMKQSVPTNKKVQENTDETLAKVLSETPEKERKSNLKKWARDLLRFKFADRYTGVVDLAESKGNERLKDLTDWAITSNARASNTIYKGRFDQNGKKKIGKSLTEILGTLPKADKQLFFEYMYHWRNVDDMSLNERFGEDDKPVFGEGFTADDSRQRISEIEEKHPEFKKRAEEIWKYVQEDLKMQIGGLISQDGYNDLLKKRPHYVPIERNVEKQKGNSSTDANKLLKKMKGSNLDILALDETLKKYTQRAYRTFDRNNLFSEIAKTLGVTDNLENESIDDVMENDIESAIETDGNYTLTFYRNGQKMSVPVDKVIYDAFKSGPQMNENLKKVADKWAQVNQIRKNLLTAWNPFFAIRNASKDLQDAGWNTKYAKKFPAKYAEAWAQIANRGEFYQQFANLGGGMSNYSARDLADAFNEQQSDKGMKKVVNRLLEINDDVETAPRLAEFMASLEAGNSVEKAMRDAAEITTNFKRGGTISKAVDKYGFTFLNASIQGYDKHVRDWKSNAKKARKAGIGGVLSLMAKLTLASGLPLRLLQDFLWRDDKDYEELSDYIKDKYYILHKTKDGKFIRINKGRIATFYQTLIMNAAETIQGKVNLWDAMVDDATSFVDNIAPNNPLENNIFAPISQTLTNKTWYGDEIVSSRLQGYNEWDQYDESTDELSKAIGRLSKKVVDATGSKAFGLSPKKVNYLLDQYSGVIGDVVLPALTLETETSVENPLLKGPATALLNSFTSDPVLKNQNVADFYALNESLLKDTKNKDATDEQILSSKYMSSVSSEMGKLYAQMHEIQGSDLSNKEKMEQTRELKKQINDLARNALDNYDNMDITGRYATVGGVQYYQKDDGSWVKPSKTSIEKLNDADLSDEDRNHYYTTWGDITDIRKQIKDSTPEGQKADYTKATIDAISKSDLSYKGKNTLLDSYYDSKLANHVNSMSLSDEEKYNLKVAAQLAEGQKDEKGKTISNSKARATADAYRELGLLDDVLEYIKDNNISPSEMGLSKTVYKELMGGTYQDAYNKSSKSSSKKKSSKSSSKKKSSSGSKTSSSKRYGGSGAAKGGRMSTIKAVTPKKIDVKQNNKTYLNAYQNIMNRGSKNVSSGTSGTVTCPRCGNRVSSATGRCPICGAKL